MAPSSAPAAPPVPQPLIVDAGAHACVAWWHAPTPAAGNAVPMAVVLASSWGEEDISGYDAQRALAQALAAAGLGTLRFEWPDSGDSSAATGEATLADLQAAFGAAADRARALSGAVRLAVVGVRLGALIAMHGAQARRDVDTFIGLLPVAGGRAFVREQRLRGANLAPPPAGVMLGGFAVPEALAASLSALTWPTAGTPVREALLLSTPDLRGRGAAEALAGQGVRVSAWTHVELDRLLAIAHQAELLPQAEAEIVRWLLERAADPVAEASAIAAPAVPVPADAARADGWLALEAGGSPVRERIEWIAPRPGADEPALACVVGERPAESVAPRRGIVLLSSGRERRVGPHRLWVPFARARAARGDVVLRLDIAGVGDSARRGRPDPQGIPDLYDPRCLDDVARAIEHLRRRHGVGPCTVMGVCSGAHHAWRAALSGVALQQAVVVNPLVFQWRVGLSLDPQEHAFGQIAIAADAGRSLLDPARWWKLLSGRANVGVITGALAARLRHAVRLRARALGRLLRLRLEDDLAAELERTAARGVALDFVFSGGEPGLVLLREEAGRALQRLEREERLQIREVEHADHTFADARGRAELYARLDGLLPPASAMPPTPSHCLATQPAAVLP
jgi:alpha/beta superfamily hydrolase